MYTNGVRTVVKYENVSKVFDDDFEAVKELNLKIDKGEFVCLIGPSGCGKTTSLKMVNRLIEPTKGRIWVEGQNIMEMNPVQLRRRIGYVIQQIGLFPHMTIAQNIGIVPRLLGWEKPKIEQRVTELLDLVGMEPNVYRNRFPKELSGGQQQRIGVLRALAAEPELILMDEPFGALDPITREQLQDEFKSLQERLGKTIIFVTHDMDEALKLGDRVAIMNEGKLVQIDSPDEILRNPANEFVEQFIGKNRRLQQPQDVAVGDVMIDSPVTIEGNRGLYEALEKMRKRRVDSLLVVSKDKVLRGLLTDELLRENLDKVKQVEQAMAPIKGTVSPEDTVLDAVQVMANLNQGYLPVVDGKERLVGLITRSSLVGILADVLWKVDDDGDNPQESKEGFAS